MVIEYKELVTGIRERKGEFMIKTIESYGRLVMYVINKIFADLHDKNMANEWYDDVFITVWFNIECFDEIKGDFKSWIIGITKYKAQNIFLQFMTFIIIYYLKMLFVYVLYNRMLNSGIQGGNKMKKQNTLKITITYAVFSLMWIAFSNKALGQLSNDMVGILNLDQYRGYFYVVMSTAVLYFVINNMEIRSISKITTLKTKNTVLKQEVDNLKMKLDFNEHAKRRLESYANTDELTRVYSRRKGLELIRDQMDKAAALKNSMLIAFIDIDNLKMINDKYGHIEGDILLTSAAKIIKDSLAREDIICRYGGDEFLAVLPGACMKDMQGIKARLEAAISKHNTQSSKSYAINISIGFSEYSINNCKHIEELIQEADDTMFISKRRKKLQVIGNFR